MSISLASIHVYPIKSLGGFSVEEAYLTDRGLEHDRRWMLVDENGLFLSQRELASMACLHTTAGAGGFHVTDVRNGDILDLPWTMDEGEETEVQVWEDRVPAILAPKEHSDRFSEKLSREVRLVFMPERAQRAVDPAYAHGITSLSDGFPYLIVSQASLDDLNARVEDDMIKRSGDLKIEMRPAPLLMDRFRPNLVIGGGSAYQEDGWKEITIGDARFQLVKPCSRCAITTTDQRTGERGKEPLRTLATYRRRKGDPHKVDFGMNAMGDRQGTIRVGDELRFERT